MKISEIINEKYEPAKNAALALEPYQNLVKDYIDHGTYIYRGMRDTGEVVKLDASKLNRAARNTDNYANVLTGFLPSWNGWPARYQSIPASTNFSQAKGYGSAVYVLIPAENQKIAVCNNSPDFWDNFPMSVDELNHLLRSLFIQLSDHQQRKDARYNDSLDDPKKIIKMLDTALDKIRNMSPDDLKNAVSPNLYRLLQTALSIISEDFPSSALKFLNELLDPNYGCSLVNGYKQIPMDHENEVWFTGKIILIRYNYFNKIIDNDELLNKVLTL
jgi:hypothetical protein